MQIVLGVPLSLAGIGFSLWSIVILGPSSTYGNEGPLILRGPYRISRNPQYLGFIVALIGWSIITSSWATILAALVWIIPLCNRGRTSYFNFKNYQCYSFQMPRQSRIDAPGALHHIIARGNEKRKIFGDKLDRQQFIARLGGTKGGASGLWAPWSNL